MPSALETLVKILKLEQDTGYQNKAVISGLQSLASHWGNDAHSQAKKPEHHLLVDELVALMNNYGDLSVSSDRHDAIKYMLGRITGRIANPASPLPGLEISFSLETYITLYPVVERRESSVERDNDATNQDSKERRPRQDKPPRPPKRNQQRVESSSSNQPSQPNGENLQAGVQNPDINAENNAPRSFVVDESPANYNANRKRKRDEGAESMPNSSPNATADAPSDAATTVQYVETDDNSASIQPASPDRERQPSDEPARGLPIRQPEQSRWGRAPTSRRNGRNVQADLDRLRALRAPVTNIDGVGPKVAEKLAPLELQTVEDVLYFFPRRYDDYTQLLPIAKLKPGTKATIIAEVRSAVMIKGKRGQEILNITVGDGTGTLTVAFFGQPYLRSKFERGTQSVFSGKIDQFLGKLTMNQPEWEPLEREALHTRSIVPIYSLTRGTTAHMLRKIVKSALDRFADQVPEYMPETVLDRVQLADLPWTIRQIHFPETLDTLKHARRRLAFDQLLLLQLGVLQNRREWQARPSEPLAVEDSWLDGFINALPYQLTGAQIRSIQAIREDIARPVPMNRLLQGDVGAGKTVVAVTVMAIAVQSGFQAAIMAPTGILAEQHYKGIRKLLEGVPGGEHINIKLLTSATPAAERADTLWGLGEGSVHIIVGTHALLQDDVNFWRLGLAIIDEQHRFGVEQRGKLRGKGTNPHVLVMTATPIPRTLALTMYADLDLSILDEMPPGRSPIDTRILFAKERERAYHFIDAQIAKGHQAFIVYPLVEASESEAMSEVRSAVEEFERLQKEIFPNYKLGLLHGRLSAAEKDAVMGAFSRNESQILVSTSVVEVGIDVPNATVMMIEGANRFGLAQLHQFRGRVGRGSFPSFCLLIPDDEDMTNARLQAMEATTDGFKLAEMDWEQRGAGDLLGTRQSGGSARIGDILGETIDIRLVEEAQVEARTLFEEDPDLNLPEHAALRQIIQQRYDQRVDQSDMS